MDTRNKYETPSDSLAVYVHFPWCKAKCPYCDFLSIPGEPQEIPHEAYAEAVLQELRIRAKQWQGRSIHSIFFGGGTPSLWAHESLGKVIKLLREEADFLPGVEITAECNPGSLSANRAHGLLAQGVNRLSIGVQSLNPERLKFLGRWHSPEEAIQALKIAQSVGFPGLSADLIFGLPGQSAEDASKEVDTLLSLGLNHLSAYALTVESGTKFGELLRAGRLPQLPEKEVALCFEAIEKRMNEHGLEHYEVSNYARPGYRSKHNLTYWEGGAYLGVGVGSWGTISEGAQRYRYRNSPQIERYLKAAFELPSIDAVKGVPMTNQSVPVLEALDTATLWSERFLLGLRLKHGVDIRRGESEVGGSPWNSERFEQLIKEVRRSRLIARDAAGTILDAESIKSAPEAVAYLAIPHEYWLISDDIISRLI